MNISKNFILIFFLIIHVIGYSCINEYRTKLNGSKHYVNVTFDYHSSNFELDTLKLRRESENLLKKYQETDSIEFYSDYGAKLIYLKEYSKALTIYKQIEQIQPNLYTTASNVGTLYELLGQPEKALKWIKKSIELNPDSHHGSEWIHIKILEHKLNTNKHTSVLGLDFGRDSKPININNYDLNELLRHLNYQISERLNFIQPKNEIIGELYYDLGNVQALTDYLENAINCYKNAEKFGFTSHLMTQRKLEFEQIIGFEDRRNNFAIVFIITLFTIMAIVFYIRKRKKRSKVY
ncbi:tetratricopeptide repeat protein [Subsaxibacter sp. CAU 1640]|uniref:tetratricopeptide repeat protein n=1 Tax=Subsaxibacter sp. CAU 1640 TaxID=2933271 RepID=UPI00200436F1|nr:tetratricopeptide repeat protein [Subsaxibacter sp. CAU 1640]MCK7589995.1 tetratricopeptide repeat protein [Subsaxibacter sp. CAU 1640]